MFKRMCFSISLIFVLSLVHTSYGATDQWIKLDIDKVGDVNTEPNFTSFTLLDSGNEVNGVIIEFGGNIDDQRRDYPSGAWSGDVYYRRCYEDVYRDFVFGVYPDGVKITLWELGASRDCNVIIYAFDDAGTPNRIANWYSNGDYLLTTDFNGGVDNWPGWDGYDDDEDMYAFIGTATADEKFGRIVLESTADPCNPAGQPFAFVNALVVVPSGDFVPVKYARRPVPFDEQEGVPVDGVLSWIPAGAFTPTHDIYLSTSETAVTDANRSNPLGVLVSQDHSTTTYNVPGFLDLNATYYWRVDEVNDAPDSIFEGDVWSFRTAPYAVLENFDSYADNTALRNIWRDYWTNGTGAEVSVETTIVRDGNSMKYWYKNDLSPYYSEAYLDTADLGINSNWLGIGAQALALYFYGDSTNPTGEQMYVKLTDGDIPANTATVMYNYMNDVTLPWWNKWSIALSEFNDVNLANVARITIGFGDGSPGDAGVVYFEDIQLDTNPGDEEFPEISGEVNFDSVYQQIEGFGGSACYDTGALAYHSSREEVYDLLFRDLGLDVLRIKNTYQISSNEITATGLIVAAARQSTRNPNLKLLLLPWSPAAYLKSHSDLGYLNSTLKKDANDPNNSAPYYYVYKAYADWWLNSLTDSGGFNSVGIYPDYISIQNEPDWGQQDQVCRFTATENLTYAGYDKAFEAVYNRIDGNVSPMPKILAPESMGFGGSQAFIDALVARGQIDHIYGFSHHLYSDGSYTNPDGMIGGMQNYATNYGDYYNKPLFQTEYGPAGTPTFAHAMLLAQHIYNCLVYEGVTLYYHWSLFRDGGYTTGGAINLNPGGGYIVRDLYWFLKHYAYFTDPGWYVINTSLGGTGAGNLRMIAFKSPDDDELTIVILNKSANGYSLQLTLNGFTPSSSEVYRSSETEHWLYIGTYSSSITLPAYSITTIHVTGTTSSVYPDCNAVQTAGYGLTSDLSGDCYVNYADLKIITDYWLNIECDLYDDCGGADFEPTDGVVNLLDLSVFAEQWMWCNDPEGAGCIENW